MPFADRRVVCPQGDTEKGLEMKKLVLSGFLASEEIYINQLEALLLVRRTRTTHARAHTHKGYEVRLAFGLKRGP
jgi:hypothetical protein